MINLNLVDFLTKTNDITGCSFASINGYTSSKGEVANHLVNLGASLGSAKAKDLKKFKTLDIVKFYNENENVFFSLDIMKKAYENVYNSLVKIGDKNLNGTTKEKSNRSYAQTNAYTMINNSVKVHNEKERLYVYALRVNKTVLVEGVYPTVNSRPLTIAQNMLKKGMAHTKFTMYIIEKADVMNLKKTSFEGENLKIDLS